MHTYQVEVEAHPTFHDGAFLEDQLYAGWTWGGSCYRSSGLLLEI